MTQKLQLLLLLSLLPLLAFAGDVTPAPSNRAVKLALTPDSTRDDVKAALSSQGVTPTEAQVDQVLAQLAAIKTGVAPAIAPAQRTAELKLTPDSTRADVKAALSAQGVTPTEAQVDQVMAQITALNKAAASGGAPSVLPGAVTPSATEKTSPVANKPKPVLGAEKRVTSGFHGYLLKKLPGMDLEFRPELNQYHSEVQVNGKPADFIIDSGAHASALSTGLCERVGVKTTQIANGQGIGGETSQYIASIDSLAIGPHIRLPAQKMRAMSMTNTQETTHVNDGLIGADILSKIGGIIDFRNHRLSYPAPDTKPDIAAQAKEAGFREITMTDGGVYSVLEAKIAGKPVRFIVDTGAQQSVLDAASAKSLGLTTVPSAVQVQGVGDTRKSIELAMPGDIQIADGVLIHRMPMLVMPLDHVQMKSLGHFDGILGADFLYASGVVFDIGNHKFYLEPGKIDTRAYGKTGAEMFASDEELKHVFATTPRVLAGKVTSFGLMDKTTTTKDGTVWRAVQVELSVTETLKGEPVAAGEKETFYVLLNDAECGLDNLKGLLSRNPSKIVFLGEKPKDGKASTTVFERTIWTDGELPRAQLKRIQK